MGLCNHRLLVERVCREIGVEPVLYHPSRIDLVVMGLGAGVVLAMADHLQQSYPDQALCVVDLPGVLSLDARILALDYLFSAYSGVALMCSSLRSGRVYPQKLAERFFQPHAEMWVYCSGIDVTESQRLWRGLGATILADPWRPAPLGETVATSAFQVDRDSTFMAYSGMSTVAQPDMTPRGV